MPGGRAKTKQVIFDRVSYELQRPIVIVSFRARKIPDVVSEEIRYPTKASNQRILEDLRLIIGDKVVPQAARVNCQTQNREQDQMNGRVIRPGSVGLGAGKRFRQASGHGMEKRAMSPASLIAQRCLWATVGRPATTGLRPAGTQANGVERCLRVDVQIDQRSGSHADHRRRAGGEAVYGRRG